MKTTRSLLALVIVATSSLVFAGERPTAEELLSAFEKSVEKVSRVRIEWTQTGREAGNDVNTTVFRDGPRWKVDRLFLPKGGGPERRGNVREQTLIRDEIVKAHLHYGAADEMPRIMLLTAYRERIATRMWVQLGPFSVIFGRMPGDAGYPLWTVMREAGSLELLPQTEIVDDVETYVLKSVGKFGEHRVWLDPARGGLPRRIEIEKLAGNLLNDEQLGTTTVPSAEAPAEAGRRIRLPARRPRSASSTRIDKIQIEGKEGVFFITAYQQGGHVTLSEGKNAPRKDGQAPERKREYKFRVDVDPLDLPEDAFRFAVVIPNGTRVAVNDDHPLEYQGPVNPEHEWVDGKIQKRLEK